MLGPAILAPSTFRLVHSASHRRWLRHNCEVDRVNTGSDRGQESESFKKRNVLSDDGPRGMTASEPIYARAGECPSSCLPSTGLLCSVMPLLARSTLHARQPKTERHREGSQREVVHLPKAALTPFVSRSNSAHRLLPFTRPSSLQQLVSI